MHRPRETPCASLIVTVRCDAIWCCSMVFLTVNDQWRLAGVDSGMGVIIAAEGIERGLLPEMGPAF